MALREDGLADEMTFAVEGVAESEQASGEAVRDDDPRAGGAKADSGHTSLPRGG